jgi:chromate transporter
MTYISLILEFFKTGLLSVGGGLATIPFLREIGEKHGWFTEQELINLIAISESTPGPLGVNMATYAGFNAAGIIGGITATLSLVLPSVIIVLLVARLMNRCGANRIIIGAFWALRPAAAGLIAGALFLLLMITLTTSESKLHLPSLGFYAVLTAACFTAEHLPRLKKIKIHPIAFIAAGAVLGVIFKIAS